MKKRIAMCFGLLAMLTICGTRVHGAEVANAESWKREVEYTEADITIIPDKYNTGCKGELTTFVMDTENTMWAGDIQIVQSGGGAKFVLDFCYRNKDKSGTVYIENYDFSSHPFVAYNENKAETPVKVVFNNCKFSNFSVGRAEGNLSYELNDCTLISCNGSNMVINRCKFGGSYVDGIVPFADVEVNDCFFADMTSVATEKGVHIDGTQIYGHADTLVQDVYYNNCRFELPAVRLADSSAYVNACIMLSLEFNSAQNMAFRNCIVNGGGYTIYAGCKYEGLTMENISFENIRFGDAAMYGIVYPNPNINVEMKDMAPTDLLYVGTVWKDESGTHFSVSNDTNRERQLVIYTDKGIFTHTIPACPAITKNNCTEYEYKDMPFDLDIVVPTDCAYAVCYDNTLAGCGTQIRFQNWTEEDVFLSEELVNTVYATKADDILLSGSCGKNITFTLTNTGVLTLSGTGDTYNYHSAKFPEWSEYIDYIKEIRVEEGIEGLGSMLFRTCKSVRKVTLPNSLTTIGQYAFGGCVSLEDFTIPANVTTLGKNVLSGTVLQEIHYAGDSWEKVELGTGNENLVERLVYDNGKPFPFVDVPINEADWKYISANYVFQKDLMSGVDEVTFAPDMSMNRAMFIQILYNMEKTPQVTYEEVFSDVKEDAWYSDAVIWAVQNNVTSGIGGGRFGSEMEITREQMAVLFYQYAQLKGYDVSQTADLETFTDEEKLSDWAVEAMQWAVGAGIISGKPGKDGDLSLAPDETATRVECAAMMCNFLQ